MPHTCTELCAPSSRQLLADHVRRTLVALGGFKIFGFDWLRPWICYAFSPVLNRLLKEKTTHFASFNARRGECDLYTYANLFEDYPIEIVRQALRGVDLVLDLGANVGAFSFLVTALCEKEGLHRTIRALEPNQRNVAVLRQQPFAGALDIHEAAVGPVEGRGRLIAGENSVTDRIDFSGTGDERTVRVISLNALCDRPALVKMDVEGGEWEILQLGLPMNVRHLLLEWHPNPAAESTLEPADLVAGHWEKLSSDPYGSTMWYLRR